MLRKILAPLKDAPNHPSAPISPPKARRYIRGKENHSSPPAVHVSEPSDFRLIAHVECDPNTGLYKGIDEFMTLAVVPRGRKSPSKPSSASPQPLPLPPLRSFSQHRAENASSSSLPSSSKTISLAPEEITMHSATNLTVPSSSASLPQLAVTASKPPIGAPRRSSYTGKSQVSRPFQMRHEVHVRLDPQNPTGFSGLPRAWETILMYSGILRDEAIANPEAVIDVLNFSKTSDPTVGGRDDIRASLSRALPPIFLEKMSITSFDDATDDIGSQPDSYQLGMDYDYDDNYDDDEDYDVTPARRRPSNYALRRESFRTNNGIGEANMGVANAEPLSHTRLQTSSPKKDVQTFVVNDVDSDFMESFIGAERRQNLPDGIPEHLDAKFREDDPYQLFTRMEQIGEGSCGNVFRAVDKEGKFVALKRVKPENERDWKLYKFEVHVMQDQHGSDNLVECYDAFKHKKELWIVMEYVSAGTLGDLLAGRRFVNNLSGAEGVAEVGMNAMDERIIAYICREVLSGLQSLHAIRRVHRDIKGDNVLLDMDGSVKVADFGFCAELNKRSGKRNTVVGTPFWMAPEVIRGANYDCQVDMWSTGVLAYECAEGRPPHIGVSPIRAMFLIATQGAPRLSQGGRWSAELQDFIKSCCEIEGAKRPTAEEALRHDFLRKACDRSEAAAFFNEEMERRMQVRRGMGGGASGGSSGGSRGGSRGGSSGNSGMGTKR